MKCYGWLDRECEDDALRCAGQCVRDWATHDARVKAEEKSRGR